METTRTISGCSAYGSVDGGISKCSHVGIEPRKLCLEASKKNHAGNDITVHKPEQRSGPASQTLSWAQDRPLAQANNKRHRAYTAPF